MPTAKDFTDWSLWPLEDELGETLLAELLVWPGVATRPVMGTLAFFCGKHMLGCYVNRALSEKRAEWLGRADDQPSFGCGCARQTRRRHCAVPACAQRVSASPPGSKSGRLSRALKKPEVSF